MSPAVRALLDEARQMIVKVNEIQASGDAEAMDAVMPQLLALRDKLTTAIEEREATRWHDSGSGPGWSGDDE
jgi:hypothetical protein